uniref:PlsC domain-containing protein n=1 Tax=Rhabditophanes sp. KR3021 TaxID=114890 RepID=A0AC35U5Y4_9BILA
MTATLCFLFEWAADETETLEEILEEPPKEAESIEVKENTLRRRHSSTDRIIQKEKSESVKNKLDDSETPNPSNTTVVTIFQDSLDFVTAGFEAIIDDEVTSRFKAETLVSWNLLSRNKANYVHINWRVSLLYFLGIIARYTLALHIRVGLFLIGLLLLICSTATIGLIPRGQFKKALNRKVMLMCMRIFSRSFSSIIKFHDTQNRAKGGGICVANHTSPIDVMILSCDNCYAMIGQQHGGFLGFLQKTLSKSTDHIWFERSAAKDRQAVSSRMQEHVNDSHKLPILIFPEGTCINNTSVMQFKKGSFEIASTIYPIAMKYDSRLGDAFWNSSLQGYGQYLWMMMTSWAIICDVWYLPPMTRKEGESAIDFAKRVKQLIAAKGGLVDLEWDGQLKRTTVSKKLKDEHQKKYANHLYRRTSIAQYTPGLIYRRARKISMSQRLSISEPIEDLHEEDVAKGISLSEPILDEYSQMEDFDEHYTIPRDSSESPIENKAHRKNTAPCFA